MEPGHRRIAEIALAAAGEYGFTPYGVLPAAIIATRKRFATLRAEIRADLDGGGPGRGRYRQT